MKLSRSLADQYTNELKIMPDYVYNIKHYSKWGNKRVNKYSPVFQTDEGYKWKLSVCPRGDGGLGDETHLSAFVEAVKTEAEKSNKTWIRRNVHYKLAMLWSDSTEEFESFDEIKSFTNTSKNWGKSNFIDLRSLPSVINDDDSLNLSFSIIRDGDNDCSPSTEPQSALPVHGLTFGTTRRENGTRMQNLSAPEFPLEESDGFYNNNTNTEPLAVMPKLDLSELYGLKWLADVKFIFGPAKNVRTTPDRTELNAFGLVTPSNSVSSNEALLARQQIKPKNISANASAISDNSHNQGKRPSSLSHQLASSRIEFENISDSESMSSGHSGQNGYGQTLKKVKLEICDSELRFTNTSTDVIDLCDDSSDDDESPAANPDTAIPEAESLSQHEEFLLAHRVVLAFRSKYFRELLQKEHNSSTTGISVIRLSETTLESFQPLLEWIYHGRIASWDSLTLQQKKDMLIACDMFDMEDLFTSLSESFLKVDTPPSTFLEICELSDKFPKRPEFKQRCVNHFAAHKEAISDSSQFGPWVTRCCRKYPDLITQLLVAK